jgi:hypothetical protein
LKGAGDRVAALLHGCVGEILGSKPKGDASGCEVMAPTAHDQINLAAVLDHAGSVDFF